MRKSIGAGVCLVVASGLLVCGLQLELSAPATGEDLRASSVETAAQPAPETRPDAEPVEVVADTAWRTRSQEPELAPIEPPSEPTPETGTTAPRESRRAMYERLVAECEARLRPQWSADGFVAWARDRDLDLTWSPPSPLSDAQLLAAQRSGVHGLAMLSVDFTPEMGFVEGQIAERKTRLEGNPEKMDSAVTQIRAQKVTLDALIALMERALAVTPWTAADQPTRATMHESANAAPAASLSAAHAARG